MRTAANTMDRRDRGYTINAVLVAVVAVLFLCFGILLFWSQEAAQECCVGMILPIRQADLPRVNGGNHYDDEHNGIDFAFDYREDQFVNVVSPDDGTVTGRWRNTIPESGREQISVNIRDEVAPNVFLNVFLVFEPDTPNTRDVDDQDEEVLVQVGEVVTRGQLLGRLVVRDPYIVGWYPVIHWSVFMGTESDLETAHECPRDRLSPDAKAALDKLFKRLDQELGPNHPSLPLIPVCDASD